ncbi:MAG: ABC transporter substrate-binding protein [Hyphomicrobium sp.]|nr:ABC transporter substrate-binding protein [Hyphomicrobium sp.]
MFHLPIPFLSLAVAFASILLSEPGRAQNALAGPSVVVAGPASGRHAEALAAMTAGAGEAVAGRAIRITEVDDGCDAARAEGAARMIIADKPDLVIGHPCPAAAIAAAKVYAAAGVLFIALGVRHPDFTDKRAGPTIFRLAGRDDRQGQAAADELLAVAPQGKIAIVQDRTAYARSLTAAVTGELAARKIALPVVIPIVAGRRDYDAEMQKLKNAPPEAVFFAGYPSEAAVVLRSLRKAGIPAAMIASDANATDEFGAAAASVDPSTPAIKVMIRAPQSGGMNSADLKWAASRALTMWLSLKENSQPSEIPGRLAVSEAGGEDRLQFDAKGDARVPSFAAVPLVKGRWTRRANAGPSKEPVPP